MKNNFKIYEGFDNFIHTSIGIIKRNLISSKKIKENANLSYEYSLSLNNLSDNDFLKLLLKTAHDIRRKKNDKIKYIGVIAQAVKRIFGYFPYIEQLMGVHALVNSYIIQMHTGEGKTLTAAMGAVYKAWQTGNCHVVTSNDYLAQRDALKMEEFFSLCNLDVGFVVSTIEPTKRKEIYDKKIVYSTSKELLADYLRDKDNFIFERFDTQNLFEKIKKNREKQKVMRGLDCVIIDEADSVLADEATVPLIIASQEDQPFFHESLEIIYSFSKKMSENIEFKVDKQYKEIILTEKGKEFLEKNKDKIPKTWQVEVRREYLLKQILIAEYFYKRNINYVVEDGKIVIIDEKTGRLMHGRSWSGALHQAIEKKENLELTKMTKTHKKMSFQFFFRLYKDLSGMSGTLHNIHNEIWSIYETLTLNIPTHSKKQVTFLKEVICIDEQTKWQEVSYKAILEAKKGRAVLIGTRSIEESHLLYDLIVKKFSNTTLLNANFQNEEAQIIAKAGESYKITIATNIAGRGTDIILTEEALENGGLHVISTQRHESVRVDIQLYGRTGRQGQIGSVKSIISLEDYLFENYSSKFILKIMKKILKNKYGYNLVKIYCYFLQLKSENSISKIRKNAFINDIKMTKKMSFT